MTAFRWRCASSRETRRRPARSSLWSRYSRTSSACRSWWCAPTADCLHTRTARTTASATGHSLRCSPSRSSRDIFRNGRWTARGGVRPALTRNTTSAPWTPRSIARRFSTRNVGTPPRCPPERRWSSASSSRSHSSTRRTSLMCANGRWAVRSPCCRKGRA